MSINSAMQAGVSGLVANSSALAAISDNIANVNTVAYKRNDTSFETVVTGAAQRGQYNAGGVLASTRQQVSQQGLLAQTSSATDLGIQGNGFFVTADKATGLTATDSRVFTRAGSFEVDKDGYLVNSAGYYLQGWPVDQNGNVAPDPSDLNRLQAINVGSISGVAEPTTTVNINANLSSSQAVSQAATAAGAAPPGAGAYDAAANNMASYDPDAGTGVKPDYSMQLPVSDSQGGQRTLEIDFLRSSTPNQWYAEIRAVPASDVQTAGSFVDGQVATGIVAFTPDGKLDLTKTTLFGAPAAPPAPPPDPVLDLGPSTGAPGANGSWATALGIDGQKVTINFDTAPGGLTQLASNSSTTSIQTNGTAFGNLTNVDVDDAGNVTANFDNGVSRRIAQIAVATFVNPDGLVPVTGNGYRTSLASGPYNLKTPGSGGAGSISPSTLEASTVDLSTEFTGLITTQRAYSASSKIITTADQMLQELISIIR
jgi:flagellar hook protein FlgE